MNVSLIGGQNDGYGYPNSKTGGFIMKRITFYQLCDEYLIDYHLAYEHPLIRQALLDGDDEQVIHLLKTEF
jgi:hypothetical protein